MVSLYNSSINLRNYNNNQMYLYRRTITQFRRRIRGNVWIWSVQKNDSFNKLYCQQSYSFIPSCLISKLQMWRPCTRKDAQREKLRKIRHKTVTWNVMGSTKFLNLSNHSHDNLSESSISLEYRPQILINLKGLIPNLMCRQRKRDAQHLPEKLAFLVLYETSEFQL